MYNGRCPCNIYIIHTSLRDYIWLFLLWSRLHIGLPLFFVISSFCIFVFLLSLIFCPKKKPIEAVLFHLVGSYLFPSCVVSLFIGIFSSFVLDLTCFTFHVFPSSILHYGVVDTLKGLTQFGSEWTRRVNNWTNFDSHSCMLMAKEHIFLSDRIDQ